MRYWSVPRIRPLSRALIHALSILSIAGLSGPASAAAVNWTTGGDGFWDIATNWSSNPTLPSAADDVTLDVAGLVTITYRLGTTTINSLTSQENLLVTGGSLTVANAYTNAANTTMSNGTLTLNGVSTLASLTHSFGTVSGSGLVTVTGASSWLAGTHTGSGTTQFDAALSISNNGTKGILGSRTVSLNGTTTWSGNTASNNGTISLASTATLNNAGSFSDTNAFNSTVTGGTFNNSGSFSKQSNTTTTISSVFNNTGSVNVNAGTMLMQSGGTSTGTYNLAAGTVIEFRNGDHTLNNVTTSGAGTLQISTENVGADALVTINGGTLNSAFLMSGSAMNGADQVFQGPATWTGGTINGTAAQSTTFAGTLTISGANTKVLSGGRSLNAVDTTWTGNTGNGNNAISLGGSGTFNNTGNFTDANGFDSSISAGTFNNSGNFNKQSNTTSSIGTVFNNTGTVNVNAGTMLMNGGGTSTGVFNIANGAELEYRNGTHALDGATMNGAGTFQISSDGVGADAFVAVNGGTLNTAFLLSGSTLRGADHVFQGPATWTGGTINGTAAQSTTFANTLDISGANAKTLSGGRILNAGNTTWTDNTGNGNNAISLGGSSTFNNTGSFTDANGFDSSITAGTFNNIGAFNKQSNTTTSVGTVFNNTGTVNVNGGTMLMNGGGTSTGVFNIANGAKLDYRNGSHALNNVTTSGAGTFEISTENVGADATVALNGGTHTTAFVLSGSVLTGTSHTFQGLATWSGGTITGAATASTTFANDLTISGPNSKTLSGGRIVNAGNTTWTGNTGNGNNAIGISGASTFNSNGIFTDANTFDSAINVGNGGGAFNNNGTFNKQSNTTTAVGTQFNSTGTVNVSAGTMLMNGGGTSTGVFNIAAGAKLEFRNGDHTLNNVTTSGAGIFEISTENVGADAFVTVNGGTHTTAFVLSGSAMGGTDATIQGPVTWTGGGISGAAATTFSNNVAISGPNLKTIVGGRTVNLNATTTWSGNTADNNNAIRFWNGATINNNGTFNDANAFASFIEHNVGGPHNFNNNGTYNKQSSTITTVDLGVVFNNSGTLNLNAGTMRFVSGTQGPTGTVQVASGATFQHDAASTVGNMITAGNLVLAGQTLTVFSDYNNANFGAATTSTGERTLRSPVPATASLLRAMRTRASPGRTSATAPRRRRRS